MPPLKTASTRKARRRDKLARWVITLCGVTVIASVVAILALIVGVTIPMFQTPRVGVAGTCRLPKSLPQEDVLRLGIDLDLSGGNVAGFVWSRDGAASWIDLRTGKLLGRERPSPPAGDANTTLQHVEPLGHGKYSLLWSNGAASLVEIVRQEPAGAKAGDPLYAVRTLASMPPASGAETVSRGFLRRSDSGAVTRVTFLPDARISVVRQVTSENALGDEETSRRETVLHEDVIAHIRAATMDHEGSTLYAGADDGRLVRWRFDAEGQVDQREVVRAFADRRAVTALALLLGDVSLAVGDSKGELTAWFPVNADGSRKLHLAHRLRPHAGAIRTILPSERTKSILSISDDGTVHLDHMTSERSLASIASEPDHPLRLAAVGPRGDALLALDSSGTMTAWRIEGGCPEVSLKTLFGKVLYEGYDEPEYVWQTTGGEDFEAKFSLVPLIFGTLKGTFYAMLFAAPLALFGAMYVSYFASPKLRGAIKPVIEIMASAPSVVIGFLVALWLAPIIESWLFAFFLSLIAMPAAFVSFMVVWQLVRGFGWAKRIERGYEVFPILLVLLAGAGLTACAAVPLERGLFGGTCRRQILLVSTGAVVIAATLLAFGAMRRSLRRFDGAAQANGSRKSLALLGKHLWMLGAIALGAAIAWWLAGLLESRLFPADFSGNFRQWLYRGPLAAKYDQQNNVLIAFGLGFTVIPIIFSIAEDSLSNVPYSMTAASMAVGASRWQTLWRVVLPSASPGIFAAMMIGFGRAVGETMIVLMATGNTPILSASPFNGMRTLSANIAVEIPEAPVDGTLYRVLFLCAVLLFLMTFAVNTAAELVRQRLRKRFGRF